MPDRTWKRSDITDEMVCRAYQRLAEIRAEEEARSANLTLGEILERAFTNAQRSPDPVFADSILLEMTGAPEKVIYRAMERADERGLIDYGVTLRSGWLTDKGRSLIAAPP